MVGYSCVIRDETERKKTAQALIRSEKIASVGRLASSIAHEINNPLEAVTNLLYIMEGDPTLEAQTRNYLEMAQKELSRVSHVAMHTLRFHRQSTRATPTEMGPLLDSVLALYESRLRNVQITVERQYSAAPLIHVFESEVRQVFANLIANAADALQGAEQRIVVLRVRPSHDWRTRKAGVTVSVADTGCGISEEAKRHLFEAFYSTKGIGGTGLGLWVSKEIIERHGGKFHVRSREGVGTVFSVFLPSTNAPSVT